MERKNNIQNIAKGLLICSVLYFHINIVLDYSVISQFNILFFIFPCVIGVFFFYAGYNFNPQKRTPKQSILRRTKQLMLPWLIIWVLATVLVVPMLLITNSASINSINQAYVYVAMSEPWAMISGMDITTCNFDLVLCIQSGWFLYTLWITSCVFYLIVDFVNKKLSRHILVVALLLFLSFLMGKFWGTYLPFVVNCYPVVLAIMLTASYLKKNNFLDKEDGTAIRFTKVMVFELIIILISVICYFTFGSLMVGSLKGGMFDSSITGFDAYIAYVFAIISTYIIHNVSKLISKIPVVSNFFDKLGTNSAIVYMTHGIVISYVDTLIFHRDHQVFSVSAQTIIYLILVLVIYMILFRIFKKGTAKNEQRN